MSKTDLLSSEDSAKARAEGWQMYFVFDSKARVWLQRAMPLKFDKTWPHLPAFLTRLIAQAKTGDALAIKALRMTAKPPQKEKK
jgi:hypothetical protein